MAVVSRWARGWVGSASVQRPPGSLSGEDVRCLVSCEGAYAWAGIRARVCVCVRARACVWVGGRAG
eukprot:2859306-Alexandrium_andersonii.AAC.1